MYKNFLLIIAFLIGSPDVFAQSMSAQEEYRRMVDALNQRYEDFFVHEAEIKKFEAVRNSGISEQKQARDSDEKALENARQEEVKQRKVKPDTTPLEREHDLEVARQAREHDSYRKEYQSEREALEKIRQSARKIPDAKDAGLE